MKTTVGISDDEMRVVTREFVVDFHYVLIMYESTVERKPNDLILICLRQRTTNFQLKNTKTSSDLLPNHREKTREKKCLRLRRRKNAKYRFNATPAASSSWLTEI